MPKKGKNGKLEKIPAKRRGVVHVPKGTANLITISFGEIENSLREFQKGQRAVKEFLLRPKSEYIKKYLEQKTK